MTDSTSVPPAAPDPQQRWLVRMATRVRAYFADSARALGLTFLVNLVVIFSTGAIWYALGGDIALVAPVIGALVVLCGAMLPLIRGHSQDGEQKPLWPPLMLLIVPAAVLIVGLSALLVRGYVNSRPVDLTHAFILTPSGAFKEGMTVTAAAHVDHPKFRLFITFAAPEYNEAAPVCAPSSKLEVRLVSGAGHGDEQSGKAGDEFAFELGQNHKDIRLAIQMTAEPNCLLALSVASARVDD